MSLKTLLVRYFTVGIIYINIMIITIPDHPHTSKVNITSNLSSDSVTVNLDWTEEDGVSYNVSVTPPLMIRQVCSTCFELTVPYNIVYNVSVLSTLCGRNTAATVVELIYSKCVMMYDSAVMWLLQ